MKTMETPTEGLQRRSPEESSKLAAHHRRLHIRTILVPTDFSEPSTRAIKYAADVAATVGARITMLHVIEPLPSLDLAYHPLILADDQVVVNTSRRLEKLPAHEHLNAKLFAPSMVHSGIPFHEITTAAKFMDADLIVLGTHGFTGMKRVLLGSTAERVVRHAPCPVLTVRSAEDRGNAPTAARPGNAFAQLRRILVPVDFSEHSRKALRYATGLAEEFGASIDLVYVIEPLGRLKISGTVPEDFNITGAFTDLRRKLADLANVELGELVPTSPHVECGKPCEEIVKLADNHAADLIVIATHGRTGLKHVLLGSVAENVLRTAPCPVLVVRQNERDFT